MTTAPSFDAAPHAQQRLLFLDALRIAAFGLLVLYHVGMYYVSWDWHVKSPHASAALEPWMRLSSPWRLSLLFLLSGVATSVMLRRDGASAPLLGARLRRLGPPLLLGLAVVVPPQAYFEVQQRHGFTGGYFDFLQLYYSGYSGFCRAGAGCLVLPTWNHLWFVAYLLVYTAALWVLVRVWPTAPDQAAAWLQRALAGARLWWGPAALLALARVTLIDRYPPTHALVGDLYLHTCYAGVFVAGVAMARSPDLWPRLDTRRWISLALALAAWLVMLASPMTAEVVGPSTVRGLARAAFGAMQWCGVLAAIGFAHRHWNRDFAWRRYLTDAVFPVYIVHQTIIIGLAMALRPAALGAGVEGVMLLALTLALSLAVYECVRRVELLRPWFGLAPRAGALPARNPLPGEVAR
jgi:glucans biosynthesis protein C